jgi:hypothetical protein
MNIHQVNVSYAGEQDRLLLRINSQGGEEFRIWLTRRLTLQLLPVLDKSSQNQNFQKEAAAYQGDFQTPYKDQPAVLPLGEEPLLVTELNLTPQADGKLHMALLERLAQRKRDMQLVMDASLTQGLLRLLHQALKTSDWLQVPNLQLLPPHTATQLGQEEPEQAPKDKPRYLN